MERNTVVELMRVKKKEYYKDMIDKGNSTIIWKMLKEITRDESNGNREDKNVDFGNLDGTTRIQYSTDKFNLFYVQNIDNIIL